MGQELVSQQHRLCRLRVGFSRHDRIRMRRCLSSQSIHQVAHIGSDVTHGVTNPHAEQCRNLIVTGPTCAKTTTELRAHNVDESALHGAVDILISRFRDELAASHALAQCGESVEHCLQVAIREQTGPVEHLRVSLRREDVIGGEHPVKVGRHAQRKHCLTGAAGEATTPQSTLVCAVRGGVIFGVHFRHVCPLKVLKLRDRACTRSWRTGRAAARSPWPASGRRCRRCRKWPG